MTQRRSLLMGAIAAPALLHIPRAQAQEITLRLHHFLPAASNVHRHFLMPWAAKIAAEKAAMRNLGEFNA